MILQQQNVVFDFGSVDQKRGKNHLPIGRLINAENVQQDKTKVYKRRFSDDVQSMSNKPADAIDMIGADWGMVARSSADIRVADTTGAAWRTLGASTPVGLERADMVIRDAGKYPTGAEANGKFFVFANKLSAYFFTVIDSATGAEIVPNTVCAVSVVGAGKAVASGNNAYLFYMTADVTRIQVSKVTPAGVVTQFSIQMNAADSITNFDVTLGPIGQPLVAVWGAKTNNVANSATAYYIDTATNGIQASPGAVTQALGAVPGTLGCWLSDKSGNYPFYLATTVAGGTLTLYGVTAATLVFAATVGTPVVLASSANGCLVGYVLDDGLPTWNLFYTNGTVASVDLQTVLKYDYRNAVSTAGFIRNGYPMGEPFRQGSKWYLVTGCSDPARLQDAVYVYDVSASPPQIIARALYHRGGPDTNGRADISGSAPPAHDPKSQTVTWSPVSTTVQFVSNGNIASSSTGYSTYRIKLDFAAALGPMSTELSAKHVIIPGAWPQRIMGPLTELVDIGPAMFPRTVTATVVPATGALLAGTYSFRAIYVFTNGEDEIRSAPSPVQTVVVGANGSSIDFALQTLRKINNSAPCFIKLYMSKLGGSSTFLARITDNVISADTTTVNIGIEPIAGEEPYTVGGVAERGSPPGCYSCFSWRDRTFLVGTEINDEVWVSSADPDVIGFDDLVAFRILSGAGRVYAGAPVDYNSAVLWKGDSAFSINGPGPSLLGSGTYTPLGLNGAPGCTNPHSVVTSDQGAYFQSASDIPPTGDDSALWLMQRGLSAVYIGAGAKDLEGTTVQAVALVPKRRQIRFYLNATTALVWDYGNPLPEEGSLGQWYTWTNLPATMRGACVRNGTAYIIQADGTLLAESDTNYTTTALPLLRFPIVFAGIAGLACVYEGVLIGSFDAAATIQVDYEANGGTAEGGTIQTFTKAVAAAPAALRFLPDAMDAASVIVTVRETSTGGGTSPRFSFEGIGFVVGIQPGLRRLNTSQNM